MIQSIIDFFGEGKAFIFVPMLVLIGTLIFISVVAFVGGIGFLVTVFVDTWIGIEYDLARIP